MQKPSINLTSSTNQPSSSSSSSSSITTHSLISSIDSSSSFQSLYPSRCFGLNLLVKAIHQVTAGSVIGVPYIQRRIIIRRRRPVHFDNLILTTTRLLSSESKSKPKPLKVKTKRKQRVNVTIPLKYRDSVIHPLTPIRRSERSKSMKFTGV